MRNLIILLLSLGFAISTPLSADVATVGKITHIKGRVDITRDGKAAIPAAVNDKVLIGDIIRTKSRSKAEILFKDGSILRLASSTRVKVTEYIIGKDKASSVINLFRGKIQSKVAKTLGRLFGFRKRNRFEVHTPTAVVGVRGTDFFTFYQRGISGSIFKEGTGYGYSLNRPDDMKEIKAGQAMLVANPDQPPILRPASDKEIQQHEGDTAPPENTEDENDTGDDSNAANTKDGENQTDDEGVTEGENGEEDGSIEEDQHADEESGTDQENENGMEQDGAADEGDPSDEGMHEGGEGNDGPPEDEFNDTGELEDDGPEGETHESDMDGIAEGEPNDMGPEDDGFGDDDQREGEVEGQPPVEDPPDEPEPPPQDPTGEDPLLIASQQDDPNAYDPEAGDPGMVGPEQGEPLPMGPEPSEPYPMEPYPMEPYPMEPYPMEPYPMDPYPMDPYPMDPYPMDPTVPYIPPEIPDEPPPMEVLFDGAILRLVSGTATQGIYYDPNATSWPYDQTPDSSGPYDGESYEYFYISDGNGNYLYGRDETWNNSSGSMTEHEYLPNGRVITLLEQHETYSLEISSTGTWQGDLSYLGQAPTADHVLRYSENAPFNALSTSGWFRGGITSGMNDLWITPQSPFAMRGEYNSTSAPSIFGMPINQITPDGGAYTGFIGGFIGDMTDDDIEGRTYSIYVDPNNEAGILKGGFAGSKDPGNGTWEASGDIIREPITSNIGSINASTLLNNLDKGIMDADGISGNFGGNGFIKSKGGHGTTIAIQGQDWGIFKLFQGGNNVYENPANSTSWAAGFKGWGKFGSFQDDSGAWKDDFGIWQAGFNNGSWNNGKLSGAFGPNSRFITLTKIGTIEGEILGTYGGAGSSGTWQAVSMGSWAKTQDLTFSTYLDGHNYKLKDGKSGYFNYSDGSEYRYYYDMDGRHGGSYYYNNTDDTETRKKYRRWGLNDDLYAGEWVHDYTTQELQSYTSTGPLGNFDMASIGDAPDPFYYENYEWDEYRMAEGGYFEGILGGLANPWTATAASPAEIFLLGERDLPGNATVNPPTIFCDDMKSYNPYNNTFTTPDGGSFWGYFGGRLQSDVKGKIYDLYIAPDNSAGILKGGFSGLPGAGGGAWSAQGGMYPIQLEAGTGITPQNLYLSVKKDYFYLNGYYDYGYQAPGYGYLYDLSGTYQGNVTLYHGYADFASIQNQSWGVWQNCFGGTYSGTAQGKWSLDFEATSYIDGSRQTRLIASYDITGPWNASTNRIDGSVLGGWANLDDLSPITGISAGEIVGTFNPTDSTWQAAVVGAWVETNQFLALAATSAGRSKLEALNIPAIEIGRANLYGSDASMSVMMNDVIFFSNASGGDPKVWATNGVDGYYSTTPSVNQSVTLEGNGLSVDFQIKKWDSGNWGAKVSGGGPYNGTGTMNGDTVQMNGAAAGTYGSGTFDGTAAGVAKK